MHSDGQTGLDIFEQQCNRLLAIAYRMLGSVSEAEDAVQDTWLKWQQADQTSIRDQEAWLVTACTRHCIDALRGAHKARVDYVGPWLPEPLVADSAPSPHDQVELTSSVTTAFLILLEQLTPVERAAWILREVFDYDYADLAFALERSEAACRKLVSRAGQNLSRKEKTDPRTHQQHGNLVDSFMTALATGETGNLEQMLSRDAELWSDGGGKVISSRRVIYSSDRVAKFLAGVRRKHWQALDIDRVYVNGAPGCLLRYEQTIIACISLDLNSKGKIEKVFIMRNPDKLAHIKPACT